MRRVSTQRKLTLKERDNKGGMEESGVYSVYTPTKSRNIKVEARVLCEKLRRAVQSKLCIRISRFEIDRVHVHRSI